LAQTDQSRETVTACVAGESGQKRNPHAGALHAHHRQGAERTHLNAGGAERKRIGCGGVVIEG